MMTESSRTEFCRRGLEPSHLRIVPSSSGWGRKLSTDDTIELLLMSFIYGVDKAVGLSEIAAGGLLYVFIRFKLKG